MRLRYRAGERAILHLDAGGREGSAWFFRGDKGARLARRLGGAARYDARAGAMFEAFPNDHRMPQLAAFLASYDAIGPQLLGAPVVGEPELLRYRPGLSCTFRCRLADGRRAYAKLVNGVDPAPLVALNARMAWLLEGGPVGVAPVLGTDADLNAIAYAEATGRPLDVCLSDGSEVAIGQTVDALRRFHRLAFVPNRRMTADVLLERGAEAVALVRATAPEATGPVERVLARLSRRVPTFSLRPIHADVKLEHVFLDGGRTTLIDTESVSAGPPDYDLAQLLGRLRQAELDGRVAPDLADQAERDIREAAGPHLDWCLGVVALRLARFHAQRPSPEAASRIDAIAEVLT